MAVTFETEYPALQSLVELAKALRLEDLGFTLTADKLQVAAVDPAHVMFLEGWIAVKNGPAEPQVLCISKTKFEEAIKPFKGRSPIVVEADGGRFVLKSGRMKRTLTQNGSGMQTPKKPTLPNLKVAFALPTDKVREWVKATPGQNPMVCLTVANSELTWASEPGDEEFQDTLLVSVSPDGMGAAKSSYGVDLIGDIMGPVTGREIQVQLGDDYPIAMDFEISGGRATVLLAPRLESN